MTSSETTSNVPTGPGEITAEWLTSALCDSGVIAEGTVVSDVVVVEGASGVGFLGEVAKLALTYEPPAGDAPSQIIAKFPTPSPEVRDMLFSSRIYEREHRFYRELADKTPLRTPAIYHVTCATNETPADERFMLLMEDLSSMRLGDQVAGVTIEDAKRALAALAAHHAAFWGGAGLEEARYAHIINSEVNQAGSPIYEASLPGFLEAFGSVIRPELLDWVNGYAAERPRVLDDLEAMPHTLVHFDFRADNLFFDAAGSVCVIDWQTISQGGGAADVGYFLSQNLGVDDRRTAEASLLDHYAQALAANGVDHYTSDGGAERLRADYRVGVECGWIVPVLAVGSLDFSSERAVALWTAVVERAQTALIDLGVGQ